jgi:hypothetical protein
MKTYSAPSVATKGTVTESTRAVIIGTKDPKNAMFLEGSAFGGVGFQL